MMTDQQPEPAGQDPAERGPDEQIDRVAQQAHAEIARLYEQVTAALAACQPR